MAEKYGTVPKKFTKEWWSWYWMYYKWHTLGLIFVLVLVGLTVFDIMTAEKYDLTLTYAGKDYYAEDICEKVEKKISPLCDDLDGNGKRSLYFSALHYDPETNDPEYIQAQRLKIDMAISEDETYLFIMDESVAASYMGEKPKDVAFTPLDKWLTADIKDAPTYDAYGNAYGIDISNSKFLKDAGINTEGKYLFIRYYPRKDQIKEQLKGYEAAITLANKIISEQ